MNYYNKYVFFSLFFFIFFIFFDLEARNKKGMLSVGLGYYNFLRNGYLEEQYGVPGGKYQSSKSKASYAGSMEYYFSHKYRLFRIIQPHIGFMGTHKESFYSWFGLGADIFLGKRRKIILHPNLAVGYITGQQRDIQLGYQIEFKSGGDIMYRLKNGSRIGIGGYHLSNAALGEHSTLGTLNPGSEVVLFKYQVPF